MSRIKLRFPPQKNWINEDVSSQEKTQKEEGQWKEEREGNQLCRR